MRDCTDEAVSALLGEDPVAADAAPRLSLVVRNRKPWLSIRIHRKASSKKVTFQIRATLCLNCIGCLHCFWQARVSQLFVPIIQAKGLIQFTRSKKWKTMRSQ